MSPLYNPCDLDDALFKSILSMKTYNHSNVVDFGEDALDVTYDFLSIFLSPLFIIILRLKFKKINRFRHVSNI